MNSVADLTLSSVVEAWGIERVQDVVGAIQAGANFVAVQNGAGQARVLEAKLVEKASSDMILDMIRGGREAIYVDAASQTGALPEHRPLLVRDGENLLGLLDDDEFVPEVEPAAPKPWSGSGGADAQEAALNAIRSARETFRHKGIALILDIQPSRVNTDPRLVQDLVDHLLEGALEIIDRNGGGSGVHVTVGQGEAGLWIGVEDNGTKTFRYDARELLEDGPMDDLALLGIRRMRDKVNEAGGQMRIEPTRTGTRFMVCLPAPS
jgi:signal transduction histidine kinase